VQPTVAAQGFVRPLRGRIILTPLPWAAPAAIQVLSRRDNHRLEPHALTMCVQPSLRRTAACHCRSRATPDSSACASRELEWRTPAAFQLPAKGCPGYFGATLGERPARFINPEWVEPPVPKVRPPQPLQRPLQESKMPERGASLRSKTAKKSRSNAPRSVRDDTFCRGFLQGWGAFPARHPARWNAVGVHSSGHSVTLRFRIAARFFRLRQP
jgi:hypothetical protein